MIPIKAKFTSKCKKCGGQIEKGEDCWYQPGAGVWHMDCREDENIMQEPAESIIQATKPKDSKYKVGDRVIYNNEEYIYYSNISIIDTETGNIYRIMVYG